MDVRKVVFYANDKPRERRIGISLQRGAQAHGIDFEIRSKNDYGDGRRHEGPDGEADLVMAYGVKSRDLLRDHHRAGMSWAIIDKGYIRRSGPHGVELYSRISVNETYPLRAMAKKAPKPPDRWERLKIKLRPMRWSREGSHILLAGSSQKFYEYFGLGDEEVLHTLFAMRIRKAMMRGLVKKRPIIFRPKPSYSKRHQDAQDVAAQYGADGFSDPWEKNGIQKALAQAHCLVTFASNAACDAIFHGVPAVVLGPHITHPVCERQLRNIDNPFWPTEEQRRKWAYNLAYEQWTLEEMESGEAWQHLIPRIQNGPDLKSEWYSAKEDPRYQRAMDVDAS